MLQNSHTATRPGGTISTCGILIGIYIIVLLNADIYSLTQNSDSICCIYHEEGQTNDWHIANDNEWELFFVWKLLYLDSNVTVICSRWPYRRYVGIGSGNDLIPPSTLWIIFWTNYELVCCACLCILARMHAWGLISYFLFHSGKLREHIGICLKIVSCIVYMFSNKYTCIWIYTLQSFMYTYISMKMRNDNEGYCSHYAYSFISCGTIFHGNLNCLESYAGSCWVLWSFPQYLCFHIPPP